jgi:hypothetical protein
LTPLRFCLAINLLSRILNKTGYGYLIDRENKTKSTHLLYMDDIKLNAASRKELDYLLKLTESFSNEIKMKFGIEKCKLNSIMKGKHQDSEPYRLEVEENQINT